jgi:pimeloyl-ACP methyl ester carboxylesterase
MKLNMKETGSGDKVAILLHGFNCDSGDWWEFAPVLVEKGYRVQALDFRGHGHSPRADSYSIADYASDVIETVEPHPDVIIGHSLGGRVIAELVDTILPSRAIYLDPPFSPIDESQRASLFPDLSKIPSMSDEELALTLRRDFPAWSEKAVEVDVASWRLWDPKTATFIGKIAESGFPNSAVVPSLVMAADPSIVFREPEQHLARERGFEVRVAPGLTHSLFRDDFATFMRTLDGWI